LIRTGIIQGQTGGNYWNLDSGEFYTATDDRGVNIKDGRVFFYDPSDPDFNGYLTTGQMGVTEELNDQTADPVTRVGMFSTSEWLEFGSVDPMGRKQKGISIYTPAVGLTDVPWGQLYARGVFASGFIGHGVNVANTSDPDYGEVKCVKLTQTSDERLKNVLEWDDRYIDALNEIEPVLFRWTNNDSGIYAGFIAQKVKQALENHGLDPSGIVGDGEHLTLHYDSIFTLLMAKVKRQQAKIDDLEKRLERLEKRCE
jgi:hypothetical protein